MRGCSSKGADRTDNPASSVRDAISTCWLRTAGETVWTRAALGNTATLHGFSGYTGTTLIVPDNVAAPCIAASPETVAAEHRAAESKVIVAVVGPGAVNSQKVSVAETAEVANVANGTETDAAACVLTVSASVGRATSAADTANAVGKPLKTGVSLCAVEIPAISPVAVAT